MELFWYVAKQLSLTSDKWKHIVLGWNTSKMIKSINAMKLRLYSFKKKMLQYAYMYQKNLCI